MLLSVIAPCRNEAAYITPFCDSVAAQRLPPGVALEVLIADGASDDGTHERLAEFCARDARFRWLGNPGRIVSSGLNRCIEQARGEVIARLDIHSTYAPDCLAECLAALERSGADNVGGAWVAEGRTPMQRAIARAFQSRWVVGGARSRDRAYEGEVDTAMDLEKLLAARQLRALRRLRRATGAQPGRRAQPAHPHGWWAHLPDRAHPLGLQSARITAAPVPPAAAIRLAGGPFVMRKAPAQPGIAKTQPLVPALFVAALLGGALLLPWAAWPLMALLLAYGAYLALASTPSPRGRARRMLVWPAPGGGCQW